MVLTTYVAGKNLPETHSNIQVLLHTLNKDTMATSINASHYPATF